MLLLLIKATGNSKDKRNHSISRVVIGRSLAAIHRKEAVVHHAGVHHSEVALQEMVHNNQEEGSVVVLIGAEVGSPLVEVPRGAEEGSVGDQREEEEGSPVVDHQREVDSAEVIVAETVVVAVEVVAEAAAEAAQKEAASRDSRRNESLTFN